jgi:chloramphenicol O-acetyltransferase type A
MKRTMNIDAWVRKDHYHFFRQFEEPFFGVCVSIDCTKAYRAAKEQQASFFLYYLHKSLAAANATEPFRYRISGDDVIIYDETHASPTINRPNGTFGFAYIDYHASFAEFVKGAQAEIDRVQTGTGLVPTVSGENVIHYSSLPWIDFTALSHARSFSFKSSIPKISFGKMKDEQGNKIMPVSVHVHHALMDGYHVGEFLERFQELMNT